jgi:uncharacterized membrane protein YheB (UPF0754 family)
MDKGTASNLASAACFSASLLLPEGGLRTAVFSASSFAFSGGITNWLAVKMLFDRIPGLIGSGVIPARFREIRAEVKDLILEHFFDPGHLRRFFAEHAKDIDWSAYLRQSETDGSPFGSLVKKQWDKLTRKEVVQPIIDRQLSRLTESPVGGLLVMVGLDKVRPAVNQFVSAMVASMEEKVLEAADAIRPEDIDVQLDEEKVIAGVRDHIELLLEKKLEELQADDVKKMMEDVIRHHLGWVVVWGNVFGGLLGVLAYLASPWL